MKRPLVSVILPTYNGERFVEECLESIKNQTFKDYELIILDDCSTDNTTKILKRKGYRFIENKNNIGCIKNFNKGLKFAKGDFIFTIDQDMVYDKNCLEELLKTIKSDKKAGIAACKCYYYKKKNKIRSFGLKVNLLTSITKNIGRDQIDMGQFDYLKERDSMGLGLALTKKEVFDKVGLFSEDYFIYYCDVDFSIRVVKAGYKIMFSKCKSWHKKEEKEIFSEKQFIEFICDKITFMKKNSNLYSLFFFIYLFFYMPFKIITQPYLINIFSKNYKKFKNKLKKTPE